MLEVLNKLIYLCNLYLVGNEFFFLVGIGRRPLLLRFTIFCLEIEENNHV